MRSPRSALAQVLSLADAKTGVINSVTLFRNLDLDPMLACAVSNAASVAPLIGYDFDNRGAACALDPAGAVLRACGETLERYSSAIIPWKKLVRAFASDLKAPALDADNFYAFAKAQHRSADFPYAAPSPDIIKHWVKAHDVATGAPVYAPASCVYLPYAFPDEPVTHAPISTGLAAGGGFEYCLQKGAAEIIERDALMLRWKCMTPAPALDEESARACDPELARLLGSVDHLPGDWRLNLLTLDIETPVISAAFINRNGPPLTSFGIAADANPIAAAKSAVREALLSRFLLNRAEETASGESYDAASLRTLRGHLLAHAVSDELKAAFLALFGAPPSLSMKDLQARFSASATPLDALAQAGLSALSVDVTSPDIAAAGICVVRVLVPGAEPLDNDHAAQHLGGKRLRQWAKQLGVKTLNPQPHPFP